VGGRLPPLLLSDEEAVSIAVALHQVAHRSRPRSRREQLSAITKLSQVMPSPLPRARGCVTAVVVRHRLGDRTSAKLRHEIEA